MPELPSELTYGESRLPEHERVYQGSAHCLRRRGFGGEHPQSTVRTRFRPDLVVPEDPSVSSFYECVLSVAARASSTMRHS